MKFKALKKFIAATTVASMALGLVACASSAPQKPAAPKKEETKKEETKKEDTKKTDYTKLKIGVLNIGKESDTAGYTYAHTKGIRDALQNLGMSESQIVWKDDIIDDDSEATQAIIKKAIDECLAAGCKLIFATSWGHKTQMEIAAKANPDVYFAHGTGDLSNGTNFINYFGRIYQARYLSGIAAGLKTKSNKIGYVSAWGTDNSECTGGINAFAMGVASVNPNAKVYVRTTNSWYDPAAEQAAAKWLVERGADVIAQHCDTAGPAQEAEKGNAFAIGWNSDMSKEAPKAVLTSVVWHWDAFYTWAIQSVCDGTWDGKNYLGGLNEGMVSITDLADFNAPDAAAKIKEAQDKMINGTWDVFQGVIETNDGKTVGVEGKSLPDEEILFGIHWYYKNVQVTK